jgi:hypothetical protein
MLQRNEKLVMSTPELKNNSHEQLSPNQEHRFSPRLNNTKKANQVVKSFIKRKQDYHFYKNHLSMGQEYLYKSETRKHEST